MRLFVENRYALLALVLVALLVLLVVAHVTRPGSESAALDRGERMVTPVESTVRVCPPPQGGDDHEIVAFAAPEELGENAAATTDDAVGSAVATENESDADVVDEAPSPGEPWQVDPDETDEQTVFRSAGSFAQGLEITQASIGDEDAPAAAEVRCGEPGLGEWFLTPGGGDLADLELFLANVDDTPATVNIDVYAAEGPLYEPDHRGIAIEAHDELSVDLLETSEVSTPVAVHVRTNRGRVAAALFGGWSEAGSDWVPPADAPGHTHVIPGLPEGGGARELVVATPHDRPAEASVRLFTPEGEVEHDSLDTVDVPPAASATLGLEGQLNEEAGTVVVESDEPVVAGVVASEDGGEADAAYTAATGPLQQPLDSRTVLIPPPDTEGAVVLGAVEADVQVRLTPVLEVDDDDDNGEGEWSTGPVTEVSLAADHTERVPLDELEGVDDLDDVAVVQVRLTEDSGPVHAAHVTEFVGDDDSSTSIRPLHPTPDRVALPATGDSLSSVVP